MQGRWRDAQMAVGRNRVDQLQRAPLQFAGSQNFRRDWGYGPVGGEQGHLQHDATGALCINQHQVVVGVEQRQEVA
ncbi:hypothetical protein D9M68_858460 [compost metagenome]